MIICTFQQIEVYTNPDYVDKHQLTPLFQTIFAKIFNNLEPIHKMIV